MRKKYIITLIVMNLCLILGLIFFVTSNRKEVVIKPMEVFNPKEKISFTSSWGAYDSKAPRLKSIFKKLSEQYSNLEIEDSSMAGAEFLFILKTDFASGNDPDVFGLWPGSDFNLLIEQGKVADLTDVLMSDPEWYNRFDKRTWDYVTADDRIYGLPIEMIYEGLFINRDLFETYEVKVPTNFEELLEAIAVFKAHEIIPIAYNQTPEGSYIYQNMVMKLGGKEDVENPFDEEGNIKSCFIEGMYYMKTLYEIGAFPNNWYNIDDKERNELFINKKAAMIVQGSWLIGDNVLSSMDTTVEVVPFPDMPNGKADSSAIIYGCGNGIYHMSQKAWEDPVLRQNSLILLKELTSPQYVGELAKDSGFISNIELGDYEPKATIMGEKGKKLVSQSTELVGAVDWFINRNVWEELLIKEFPDVLRGKLTPEALCSRVSETNRNIEEVGETSGVTTN